MIFQQKSIAPLFNTKQKFNQNAHINWFGDNFQTEEFFANTCVGQMFRIILAMYSIIQLLLMVFPR